MLSATPDDDDVWSKWLMHHRHASDPVCRKIVDSAVRTIADRVIDALQLAPGMVLADIGSGEGVLAFRALERMANSIDVVLTDISKPMLRIARANAEQLSVIDRCQFIECTAEKLIVIADSTVDAVTTRASLAYVADKKAALLEFKRVLKRGGRLSMAEPILQDEAFTSRALRMAALSQTSAPEDPFLPLLHRWKAAQFPDTEQRAASHPLVNFSERDLLNMVRAAGFSDLHLELHIDISPSYITDWNVFLDTSPHPWAPPLRDIFDRQFSATERSLFEDAVRPKVEAGTNFTVDRVAYVTASKARTDVS